MSSDSTDVIPAPDRGTDRAGAGTGHGRRARRWLVAALGIALIAGLVAVGWVWRHPTAFDEAGGWGVSNTRWAVDTPLYVGMTYEKPDVRGRVTIHAARAHVVVDSADAEIAFFVCTIDESAGVGVIGAERESDIHGECSSLTPAKDNTLELSSDPREQLVMAVSLTHAGSVKIRGVDLTYSHGWQRGTQRVGGEVNLRHGER